MQVPVEIHFVNLDRSEAIEAMISAEGQAPFDLVAGPLARGHPAGECRKGRAPGPA